jgi:hypothetical protein
MQAIGGRQGFDLLRTGWSKVMMGPRNHGAGALIVEMYKRQGWRLHIMLGTLCLDIAADGVHESGAPGGILSAIHKKYLLHKRQGCGTRHHEFLVGPRRHVHVYVENTCD